MKTREQYDTIIANMKEKLGDDFSKVSDIVADLSTDYDSVIQNDKEKDESITNLKNEKVQLLETNNKLFTQVTNTKTEKEDPIFEQEKDKQDEKDKLKNISLDDVINEKGGLD